MKTTNATGRTNARRTVVKRGRTRVIKRFLTVNVQIWRKKRTIVINWDQVLISF